MVFLPQWSRKKRADLGDGKGIEESRDSMRKCSKCGRELEAEEKFCSACGEQYKGESVRVRWGIIWSVLFLILLIMGGGRFKNDPQVCFSILHYGGIALGLICGAHGMVGWRQGEKRIASWVCFVLFIAFANVVQEFRPEIEQFVNTEVAQVNQPTAEELARREEERQREERKKEWAKRAELLEKKRTYYNTIIDRTNIESGANYLWQEAWNDFRPVGSASAASIEKMRQYRFVFENSLQVYNSLVVPQGTDEKWEKLLNDCKRRADLHCRIADCALIFLQSGSIAMARDSRYGQMLDMNSEARRLDSSISNYCGAIYQQIDTEDGRLWVEKPD